MSLEAITKCATYAQFLSANIETGVSVSVISTVHEQGDNDLTGIQDLIFSGTFQKQPPGAMVRIAFCAINATEAYQRSPALQRQDHSIRMDTAAG